jgi:hypothetical protein
MITQHEQADVHGNASSIRFSGYCLYPRMGKTDSSTFLATTLTWLSPLIVRAVWARAPVDFALGFGALNFVLVISNGSTPSGDFHNPQIIGGAGLAKRNSSDDDDVLVSGCEASNGRCFSGSMYHLFIVSDVVRKDAMCAPQKAQPARYRLAGS